MIVKMMLYMCEMEH